MEKYDKSGMHKIYDIWPVLCKEYYEKNYDPVEFEETTDVVFVGMGGSGTIGDVFSSIFSKSKLHVQVVKGYHFPKTADSKTLVIATSASGNTLETLNNISAAKKNNCKIIAFSSGGRIMDYCIKNRIEHRTVPIMHSPRASFPVYLYSILNILKNKIPLSKKDVIESIAQLKKTRLQIYSSNLKENNPSLYLSEHMSTIPMIYYPAGLGSAAIRFKNSLQENAKMHAAAEDVIETCHNGIVSWEKSSIVRPILIQGKDDYVKTKLLWKIIKEYFNKNNIEYQEVYSVSGNILSKIVNLVYLLDYASIYSAILTKTDPTPVNSISFIKTKLKENSKILHV